MASSCATGGGVGAEGAAGDACRPPPVVVLPVMGLDHNQASPTALSETSGGGSGSPGGVPMTLSVAPTAGGQAGTPRLRRAPRTSSTAVVHPRV